MNTYAKIVFAQLKRFDKALAEIKQARENNFNMSGAPGAREADMVIEAADMLEEILAMLNGEQMVDNEDWED